MNNKITSDESPAIPVKNTGIILSPDLRRVILRPYIPLSEARIERIISRVLSLAEPEVKKELTNITCQFSGRHKNFEAQLEGQFESVKRYRPSDVPPSHDRRLLVGSFFLGEYSFESAALFNPSIIPHPDQTGLSPGSLRFIITLRATGEGHISSLTFRAGSIDGNYNVSIDEGHRQASTAEMKANPSYDKSCFTRKLYEMDVCNDFSKYIMESLPDEFSFSDLMEKVKLWIFDHKFSSREDKITGDKIKWLAQCNYEARFDASVHLSERVLFPLSPSEQNGIEDARFVLFTDEKGKKKYYATYTAYDGRVILPQLIETENFTHFKMITLNGRAAENKGMALFPRKINGRYAMVSRQDDENLFLMYSDNLHFWHETVPLMKPSCLWEFAKIGNCGAPIETEHGWLLLTHGVGPLRQYSISAVLLDLKDPSRVIGRLTEPLIRWNQECRSGYVPNVVYTCGALLYKNMLVLPYAMSDQKITISLIPAAQLFDKLS